MASTYSVLSKVVINNMNNAEKALSKNIDKLSSGSAINSAADNASGLGISERLESQINGGNVAQNNCQDGISMLQTADSSLSTVQNILQRMNELATGAANGTNSDTERAAYAEEFNQLIDQINKIGKDTQFNNNNIFSNDDRDSNSYTLQVGANAGDSLTLNIKTLSSSSLGLDGTSLLSQEGAAKALDTIKNAINDVSKRRSYFGASINRLEHCISNNETQVVSAADAQSRIKDCDIAKELINYCTNQAKYSASQSMFAQLTKVAEQQMSFMKSMFNR